MQAHYSSLVHTRKKATARARYWFERVPVVSKELEALQQLGLLFCQRICDGSGGLMGTVSGVLRLPRPASFVGTKRDKLLALANVISLHRPSSWHAGEASRYQWAHTFGGMALSCARSGDLSLIAALIRAAAHLGLSAPWLIEAEIYLLDQQQPDGYFGLITPELALLPNEVAALDVLLRISVEILWALAETAKRDVS